MKQNFFLVRFIEYYRNIPLSKVVLSVKDITTLNFTEVNLVRKDDVLKWLYVHLLKVL
jgi:hypothetical protein